MRRRSGGGGRICRAKEKDVCFLFGPRCARGQRPGFGRARRTVGRTGAAVRGSEGGSARRGARRRHDAQQLVVAALPLLTAVRTGAADRGSHGGGGPRFARGRRRKNTLI